MSQTKKTVVIFGESGKLPLYITMTLYLRINDEQKLTQEVEKVLS